uniref:Glutamine amidotransferase domain-containing protein n=1 Tax=Peronospora matthiolae TaxID=2874970 RepID=A0AAV1VLV8_9STRA
MCIFLSQREKTTSRSGAIHQNDKDKLTSIMLARFAKRLYHRSHAATSLAMSSAASSSSPLKVLVIDGYAPEGRAELEAGGASTAGALYTQLLNKSAPPGVTIASDVVYPSDTDFHTPELSKYHAVAWTGCSLTIHDGNDPRVAKQIDLAEKVFDKGIPQYGSCWAAQIAVVAAGGVCAANPRGREMGIARKIHLSPAGRAHPMFEGKPTVFDAFTSHYDEVTHLPPGGLALGGNEFTAVQAVAVRHKKGDFWAVQYHPEYDLYELARLTYCRRAKLVNLGFFADMKSADQHVYDLETLHLNPSRYDIAWRLGLDADVMSETVRHCETRNFIKYLALPYKAAVGAK